MNLKKLKLKPHKLFHHLDRVQSFMNREFFPPIHVEIGVTDRCQHACHFCYVEYLKKQQLEIPRELLLRIMRDLGDAGIRSLFFQGTGEPTMNPACADAIVEAKESGVDTALQTNGKGCFALMISCREERYPRLAVCPGAESKVTIAVLGLLGDPFDNFC